MKKAALLLAFEQINLVEIVDIAAVDAIEGNPKYEPRIAGRAYENPSEEYIIGLAMDSFIPSTDCTQEDFSTACKVLLDCAVRCDLITRTRRGRYKFTRVQHQAYVSRYEKVAA